MALTLDSNLATAQDSLERNPIIEVISRPIQDAIPFIGNYFNENAETERDSNTIISTTGRIYSISVLENTSNYSIVLYYTDTGRTTWNRVVLETFVYNIQNVSITELSDGNFGIVYSTYSGTTYTLRSFTISGTGTVVESPQIIDNAFSGDQFLDPYVITLSSGTYFMVYVRKDGSDYYLRKRTSSDFITWSSAGYIGTGLATTSGIGNPSVIQYSSGDLLLFFDYVDSERGDGSTIKNIYFMVSTATGSIWGSPSKITNYSTWGLSGTHPDIVEKDNTTLSLVYQEEKNLLFADENTELWQNDYNHDYSVGSDMHFNQETNKLYVYQIDSLLKRLAGIVVMDTENWEVDRVYNTASAPAYTEVFAVEPVFQHNAIGQGKFVAISTKSNIHCATMVINDQTNTINEYYFKDSAVYDFAKNIDINWRKSMHENNARIYASYIEESQNRLYLVFAHPYVWNPAIFIGYIDLTENPTPKYTWNEIVHSESMFTSNELSGISSVLVIPEYNYIVICSYSIYTWQGRMVIVGINSGGVIYDYSFDTNPSFPFGGVRYPVFYDGHIYASFPYRDEYGQGDYHGMVDIDINSGTILYRRPTWATVDDYGIYMKAITNDGKIIVASFGYGVGVYTIDDDSWVLYNNDNVSGFEPTIYDPTVLSVAYDQVTETIFCGSADITFTQAYAGIRAFNVDGSFAKGKIITGYITNDEWQWATSTNLTNNNFDFDISIANDPDDILWAIWTKKDADEYSLKWDRDINDFDLTNFIVAGSTVRIGWGVDQKNKLDFTLTSGHLFDPHNSLSTYSPLLEKGRKISVRIGETINGVDYLQNQGTFIVDSISIQYQRGTYPVLSVSCLDRSCLWDDIKIVATDNYNGSYPEDIVTDILRDFAELELSEISIDNLDNRHEISYQWVDNETSNVIEEILDHFNYIQYIDVDNVFTVKKIAIDNDIAHIYSGSEIITFSPDDNYSSYTNRIRVKGEGEYFLEVVYPEELIQNLSGTGGWWEDKDVVKRIYYSLDRKKKARNPRLVVNKSIKSFKILWIKSRGDEYISGTDTDERYVDVTIRFPGLQDVLIASISSLVVTGTLSLSCSIFTMGCGVFMFAIVTIIAGIAYILAQVATYSYDIYAQGIGEEKQLIYGEANDTDFQRKINRIVTEEIEDPFCYTIEQCKTVAKQELDVTKAQRKRINLTKISHLQDEICDTIRINHPYSSAPMNIFITNLDRVYTRPERDGKSGGIVDSISGWIV